MELHRRNQNAPDFRVEPRAFSFGAWRPAYDAHENSRRSAGITNARVFRGADDPNDLVILTDVADEAKARSWTASDDLRSAMQAAGVVGTPVIHFVP
jgi:heme-degrading monooxygenase HmoA